MTKSDWKPRRRGKFYCSPACGGKCLHRDFVRAKRLAEIAVAPLGDAWKAEVWENLGWHWSVVNVANDAISVRHSASVDRAKRWECLFNSNVAIVANGPTAAAAIQAATLQAISAAANLLADVQHAVINKGAH